jgi:acetyl-CoA carboxylase carboxyltransferase component
MPFIHIGESTGARLPDAMGSKGMGALLGNDTTQFKRMRDTPWVAAALDTSFGSSAWLCCCADFAVMKKGSIMSVSSPRLVSMAIGEKVDLEELGGWRLHAEQTGLIDYFVDTDAEAMAVIRRFLSYMPGHNGELAPGAAVAEGSGEDQDRILAVLPEKRTQVYNMKKIIEVIFDRDSFFEIKARFGRSAVVGLARLDGQAVGVIANNPQVGGGALSAEACRKIIDLTVLCDSFNLPIVRLVDTPGFVVGTEAERRGAPGHIMNFMNATCLTTVPSVTVLCRKAYGRAYVAMGGGAHNDAMIAWPTAEVSFMDPVFATSIVHNLTAGQEGFEDALAHIQKDLEIWDMARIFSAQDVVKPQETRAWVIRMLDIQRRRRSGGVGQHLMRTWPTSF